MVHDTSRGGKDDETELTRGKKVGNPLFYITDADVEARRDDATLVQSSVELNDNLS